MGVRIMIIGNRYTRFTPHGCLSNCTSPRSTRSPELREALRGRVRQQHSPDNRGLEPEISSILAFLTRLSPRCHALGPLRAFTRATSGIHDLWLKDNSTPENMGHLRMTADMPLFELTAQVEKVEKFIRARIQSAYLAPRCLMIPGHNLVGITGARSPRRQRRWRRA
jgi:hypothetical protein